jgi:hypothetical protein
MQEIRMGSVNAQGQEARRRRKLKSVPKHRNRGQLRFCQDRRALKGMAGPSGFELGRLAVPKDGAGQARVTILDA